MNTAFISFGVLIVLFTILLLAWKRRMKPQAIGFGHGECARRTDHISTQSRCWSVAWPASQS
jgi:hypothetical protein